MALISTKIKKTFSQFFKARNRITEHFPDDRVIIYQCLLDYQYQLGIVLEQPLETIFQYDCKDAENEMHLLLRDCQFLFLELQKKKRNTR